MSFLDRLEPDQRARFDALGDDVALDDGAWLLRRGDAGGDLILVREGALEVVEAGAGGPHILLVLEPGDVLGDVSFLDAAPRPADVRARGGAVVRRWRRDDVLAMVQREPALAARLYEGLARNLAQRVRQLAVTAAPRAEARPRAHEAVDPVGAAIATVVDDAKAALEQADDALRARPMDPASRDRLRDGLDRLERGLADLFAAAPPADAAARVSPWLRRELRPWLGRSRLADLCLHDTGRATVTPEVIDHVLADVARGEGWLGTHADRWLLDRPTVAARREADGVLLRALAALPPAERRRVLFLDALAPTRLDRLAAAVGDAPTTVVMVDPSVEALGAAADQLTARGLSAERIREGVVQLALGRARTPGEPADVAVLFDVLTYLPDRIAISVLRWAADELAPSGVLLATCLDDAHADDDALLAQLLHWPTVRRTAGRFERMVRGAGLVVERTVGQTGPATVVQLCRAA